MKDVIIVGAGPAGCMLGKRLAGMNWDVTIYEKRQEIGAPKRCAEGLSSNSIQELDLEIPDYCKMSPIEGANVYSPDGNHVDVKFEGTEGYILERKQFDKWLAKEAAKSGAKVRSKAEVTDLLPENKGVKGKIEGEEFTEESRMVIAADGVESLIARKAGIKKGPSNIELVDSGYQYEMTNLELEYPNRILLYFGNEIAPRGYIWIFPKDEKTANVGIGILGNEEKTAKEYLDQFIEENDLFNEASIIEVNSGGIPVGGFMESMVTDNCIAIGDSANQVNPIHGGGISEGMKAAEIAAEVIDDALSSNDTSEDKLKEFDERWWEERGQKLKKVEKIREVTEELTDDDLNYLAENLDGEDLVGFSRGKGLSKLGKLLIKRPGLIKVARKLL